MLEDIIIGVAGNIATLTLLHHAEGWRGTIVGRALARAGLIGAGFEDRLVSVLRQATVQFFFKDNADFANEKVFVFLSSPIVIDSLSDSLLNGRSIDFNRLRLLLADDLDVSGKNGLELWPHGIDPDVLLDKFFSQVRNSFLSCSDPAFSLINSTLVELASTVDRVEENISELRLEQPGVFTQALVRSQISGWEDFESQYLRHIGNRFGRLTTPGVRDLHGVKQSLSVAYISLNVKSDDQREPIRAEELLKEGRHIVIKGPAGSGKTTLLNYILWSSAQPPEKDNKWAGMIPFFIPLRSIARIESGAPIAEKLVTYSVDGESWTFPTPGGWINDVLRNQRRAIIMIDGVDELSSSRRPGFWDWVARFSEEYADNSIVITSRVLPGTISEGGNKRTPEWNLPDSFVEAQLEEMSTKDISRFIDHWHEAVDRTKLEVYEVIALSNAKMTLASKLADVSNRRIRELCSTPLLCAMVCVLHWREEGYLPRQRVELYDRCCEMLIEARDLKRSIELPMGALSFLTRNDKERVLQRLAFEMMNNRPETDEINENTYRIEIPRAKAIQWIGPWISGFQRVEATSAHPEDLLNYLIERTGLLREPAGGLVDFPHRTFQEYLAACAAGAEGQEIFLANKAEDDQWHETITLAAGTTTGGVKFGHDLVEALLKRADRHKSSKAHSQKVRKTCFALALGCLENLRQPDPVLRDRVLSRVDELVPPRDPGDARILTIAGDAAVPHLTYERWKDERTSTVAACAQALRMIGTNRAHQTLGLGYLQDRRDQVVAQVCSSELFPYSSMPFIVEHVDKSGELPFFTDVTDIASLLGLAGLKHLALSGQIPQNMHLTPNSSY